MLGKKKKKNRLQVWEGAHENVFVVVHVKLHAVVVIIFLKMNEKEGSLLW